MQLLKLSAIAHGFTLVATDDPLVTESLQAWKFGPVFPSIYEEFKHYERRPIFRPALVGGFDIRSDFFEPEKEIMTAVCTVYGELDAWELSGLTHKPDTPWTKAFDSKGWPQVRRTIDNETIKKYYQRLSNQQSSDQS